jgi:hypothetical protein
MSIVIYVVGLLAYAEIHGQDCGRAFQLGSEIVTLIKSHHPVSQRDAGNDSVESPAKCSFYCRATVEVELS